MIKQKVLKELEKPLDKMYVRVDENSTDKKNND